jgi:predicted TIM-barrel fold metal-dependent hydrolase
MTLFTHNQARLPGSFGRIFAPDRAWLDSHPVEAVLDPDLPIIDTHHHFWDLPGNRYLVDDFAADLATGHKVVGTVFVECNAMYRATGPEEMRPVGQTEFVAGMAAMSVSGNYGPAGMAQGIVGYADLALGERVRPVLQAHLQAGGGRFRGVRYATAWDASPVIGNGHNVTEPGLLLRPDIQAGLGELAALDLLYDAWVFHPQLGDVIAAARRQPDLRIVLGHVGGPLGYGPYLGRRDEVFAAWKASMRELARCPNVVAKLGGMMMRLGSHDYLARPAPLGSAELAAHWRPYMETCIELFGPERCMFESNFPVEKMGTTHLLLWNAFKHIAAGASDSEKQALFNGTARRVYRLP